MEKEFASNQKSIIKGTLLLTLSMLLVKVFGLIYKVPLSYILSDEGMGYFNTAYTVYTFFYVISTAGVPKAISILSASANDEKSDRISSAAFRSFFTIGIILSIVFVFLASPIAKGLGAPNLSQVAREFFFRGPQLFFEFRERAFLSRANELYERPLR